MGGGGIKQSRHGSYKGRKTIMVITGLFARSGLLRATRNSTINTTTREAGLFEKLAFSEGLRGDCREEEQRGL